MSNRHYLINSEDLQNLNARLLSIAFSKDEGDWKSIMHIKFIFTKETCMSNRHYLINSEDLQNLNARLLSIAFSKDEGDWKSIMHTHHFTELLFVVSGEGSFSFNQEQSPLRRGDLVIIPPYTEHTERSSQNHPLTQNIPNVPLKIIRWNIMCSELMEFHSCPKKTENAHRYSAILSMIPVFMNCSARCSTKSEPHNTVLRPSASICLRS